MNYCIINGKKSTMVKGLMIQALPSIIKPLMRSRIEEIDGRDGDIITPLGYSAYDKEMSIGLFGDYDIEEVIRYFDAEGEVIFSNELDKKYTFKILEPINFERLGRFRQATVIFHVQPFKYSSVKDVFVAENITDGFRNTDLFNHGNVPSKPILTITDWTEDVIITLMDARGEYGVSNSLQLAFPPRGIPPFLENKITIDCEKMKASGTGMNPTDQRNILVNYDRFRMVVGFNVIKVTGGTIGKLEMNNISRWI